MGKILAEVDARLGNTGDMDRKIKALFRSANPQHDGAMEESDT
jgi:hypothetical protein